MNRIDIFLVQLCVVACAALAGCVSSSLGNHKASDFSGAWSVEWCSKTDPSLDCGGFNVSLVQSGERICGDFGGALVGLRQIDEGNIIGSAIGDTAILTVQSQRNQTVLLVRAERRGETIHWKVIDDVDRGSDDINVIALDNVLKRDGRKESSPERRLEAGETCASFLN
jgi:hypothetical protein